MIKTAFSFLMAVAPAVFFLKYFYKKDYAKPEPKDLIMKTFIFGIIITIPVVIIELLFHTVDVFFIKSPFVSVFFNAFIIAALSEESFKYLIVRVFIYNNPAFDEEMDGIIYCIVAGLGFACMENILYVMNSGIGVAVTRAFTAIPLHALSAGMMGYYLGKAKFAEEPCRGKFLKTKGLISAILIHGIYDAALMGAPAIEQNFGELPAIAAVTGIIPFLIILFVALRKKMAAAIFSDRQHNRV